MTRTLPLALALTLLCGCNTVRQVEIRTVPEDGAEITVDDKPIGVSPVLYGFDFSDPEARYKVSAVKEGYVRTTKLVYQLTIDAFAERNGAVEGKEFIEVKLSEDEVWTNTVPSDAANVWVELEVSSDMDEDQVWDVLIDTLTRYYPELDNQDNQAGYIASKDKLKSLRRGPTKTVQVKNQFICSITSRNPLIYKMQVISKIDDNGEVSDYPRIFKETEGLIPDLRKRLVAE
ncbi:MAG: hypothetical protein KDD82_24525 [Planctomycetes bacterium]|nr:hypothetical protein [Planctomycetota bacterium]